MNNLIEFSVANYRSFQKKATLSLLADNKLVSKEPSVDKRNVFEALPGLSLLKSAAVYGANASGKSNLVKAVKFMRSMVINSSRETTIDQEVETEPFRLGLSNEEPSSFEAIFLIDGILYRYGFEADRKAIRAEWLFQRPDAREVRLFTRENEKISVSRRFKEGKKIEELTRSNALFLSVVAQFNGEIAQRVQGWFRNSLRIISGLSDVGYKGYTLRQCENSTTKEQIVEFLKRMDIGIEDLSLSKIPILETLPPNIPVDLKNYILANTEDEIPSVKTIHRKFDEQGKDIGQEFFEMDEHESEGTQKVFSMAGPVIDVLANGYVLFVDELDARFHPLITMALIKLFNSAETNVHRAQLVFSTHDTNLLKRDLLRRDQVWFTEKNNVGATDLYSLLEYKPRNDSALEKNYIEGRYGAIPFIGDFSDFFDGREHAA